MWRGITGGASIGRLPQLTLAVATIGLAGCSSSPVITNRSDGALTDLVVSGSGFAEHVTSPAAGASTALTVRPHGESELRVTFDSRKWHVAVDNLAYLEPSGAYPVAVTVRSDLKVEATATLPHFYWTTR
jgi:hypothetical protein